LKVESQKDWSQSKIFLVTFMLVRVLQQNISSYCMYLMLQVFHYSCIFMKPLS